MNAPRPEPGVEYGGGPPGFAEYSRAEAARSLGAWLGLEAREAGRLLESGEAAAEIRAWGPLTGMEARRITERRFRGQC